MVRKSLNIFFFLLLKVIILSSSFDVLAKQQADNSLKSKAKASGKLKAKAPVKSKVNTLAKPKDLSSIGLKGLSLYSQQAILIDLSTGEILFEQNADQAMPPSSMSKILTTYLVFEELKAGRLKMADSFPVSEASWRKGGSKMFLKVNTLVSVEELLKGAIVSSGNDACIALAEGISGSEAAFAHRMTEVAHQMGASHSNFVNATGWPDEQHYSTARDLALISQKLIENFPEYYPLYAERAFTYNNISQMNRNPLLGSFPGADGIKTGSTETGGFGLVGSAVQGGRRVIMVLNGAASKKERAIDSKALLQWGFNNFLGISLYKKGHIIEQADIWLGDKSKLGLSVAQDVKITLPRHESRNLRIELVYKAPLEAPLKKGEQVGYLRISVPHKKDSVIPVITTDSVQKAGFFSRIKGAVTYLIKGYS
jgi:D-alanyl-D-alanine carboxypeptidase (penicillin-binding protein 5/6)